MTHSRKSVVLLACAIAWIMGVRTPRAASFESIEFAGRGRATLVIEEVNELAEGEQEPLEVFAKLTYGTEISVFAKGLYARTSFVLPRTEEAAVLVVDIDRASGQTSWDANDRGLRARLYTIPSGPSGGSTRFDGRPRSGSLELEAAIVGRRSAGFRIRGWLELVDAGADGREDTEDDVGVEVDITLESIPTPEEIAGQPAPPPRVPQRGFCEVPWCWTDDGYYDGYYYGYGCADAEVGYETTSDGCDSDTVDDGSDVIIDDGGGTDGPDLGDPGTTDGVSDDGCSSEPSDGSTDSGCEGTDDGSSSDGCDGGDSGSSSSGCDDSSSGDSGCSDSGGSGSGCGSSGCEGDTLERVPDEQGPVLEEGLDENRMRKAGVDLVGGVLFAAALGTWFSDRRRRRSRGD